MDELAAAAGADPVRFRLDHLADPRARRVLAEAAQMAGWGQLAGWGSRGRRDGTGFGVAVARYKGLAGYCAAVAEVEADTSVQLRRLWLAVDVGRVINPDGVRNQVEGGAVQSASWTLREQVRFDRTQITSANWDSYPILRFTEVPQVVVRIVDSAGEAEAGGGGLAAGPGAGAIGNPGAGPGGGGRARRRTGGRRHRQRGGRRGRGAGAESPADQCADHPGDRGELVQRRIDPSGVQVQ